MPIRDALLAALVSSAAFLFSAQAFSQVPVVDASSQQDAGETGFDPNQPEGEQHFGPPADQAASTAQPDSNSQGELFYQLQILQEEVRMLRGQLEQQGHQLSQLKAQSMERYIDLDRRIGQGGAVNTGAPVTDEAAAVVASTVKSQPGEKAAYDVAYGKIRAKDLTGALKAFQTFMLDFPDGKYAPNSFYWLGELYLVVEPVDLEAARQSFTQLLELYPAHSKAPDAIYKLAKVYQLKGNKDKARSWLDKVIAEHASSSAAGRAKEMLAAGL